MNPTLVPPQIAPDIHIDISANHSVVAPIQYCIYARKSSEDDEQQTLSVDSQIKEVFDDMRSTF